MHKNCFESHGIHHIAKNGDFVTSSDDVISDVDLFVICTGYSYGFSFLSNDVDLKITYKWMRTEGLCIIYISTFSIRTNLR